MHALPLFSTAAAVERAKVPVSEIEACIMGNVLSTGLGQAPARQAALEAGLPVGCTCTTVNKVCASGMKAVMMATQDIQLGLADVVVAGGMENMSLAPFFVEKARFGIRMGHQTFADSMIHDGLWDKGDDVHMGMFAEKCSKDFDFSRA